MECPVPRQSALDSIRQTQLTEFYEKLHWESTNGDTIHAINRMRSMLEPDAEASLARKLDLVLPSALQCFFLSCGGDFVTKLHRVKMGHILSETQKDKWLKKDVNISRGACEHLLALDEFKALAHATDHKGGLAEAVFLKREGGTGVW